MSLHSADSKCQISYRYSKNGSEWTSLCAPKLLQEVNFPKSFFSSCIQDALQLCTYAAVFLCGVRWRHNRAPNWEPRFLVNFVPVWGWIASPIVHRFENCFRLLLRDQMYFATSRKTMNWIENGWQLFLMGTTSSIIVQSLGEIVQRAPAVGAKIWCLSLPVFLFVTLRVRSAVR